MWLAIGFLRVSTSSRRVNKPTQKTGRAQNSNKQLIGSTVLLWAGLKITDPSNV